MEPVLELFLEQLKGIRLNQPHTPFISNLTGAWITSAEATDPQYWARHLRETVRFSSGLQELLKGFDGVLLEVGPGDHLAAFARQHLESRTAQRVFASLRRPQAGDSDVAFLLTTLGKLWLAGVQIDWRAYDAGQPRRRVPLPTYSFERQRFWVEARNDSQAGAQSVESATTQLTVLAQPRPRLRNMYVAPASDVEQVLAAIWQELLGIEQAGIHDDFFSLGGHSLLATQLISEVRERFELDLPLHKFFEAPTIAGLAIVIEEMLREKVESLTDSEVESLLQ
jgi:acyl transferase domain-containing protein